MKVLKALLPLLFLAIALPMAAQKGVVVDRVVAIVGDNVILKSEVEAQYQQMIQQSQGEEVDTNSRCTIFENLLMERLFLAQAQLDSVVVNPDEVEAELDRRIKYFISIFGSKEKLEEYYGKTVLELKDDFRDDIEKQLTADKMKGKVFGTIKISPAEVKDFFSRIPADSIPYFNSELEIGEITMFPKVNELQKQFELDKLKGIRKEIMEGKDFAVAAVQYSEDPGSYLNGGDLGWMERGELVPSFEAVAFKLKVGELSEPVETPFGYHLIMVDERLGDKIHVRHILREPKTMNSDLAAVKDEMDSILHELRVDSLSWRDAVNAFSQDEQSKSVGGMITNSKSGTTYFEKADIDGTLIFTLDRMKVGDYSDVLPYTMQDRSTGKPKQGYRIIWLKTETKPHKASLDEDYPKIQQAAKAEKQQKMLDEWVLLHKDRNFIHIDDSMLKCEQMKKWIKEN